MIKNFISPSRYIQGPGALSKCGEHVKKVGKKVFILGGKTALSQSLEQVKKSLIDNEIEIAGIETVVGECTNKRIFECAEKAKKTASQVVIGIGGGKVIDIAKGVADESNSVSVIIPTVASNDAPTSSFSVVYTEQGIVEELRIYRANPYIVLVDTEVIAKSPVRQLVSGMGDALSTYYEARTCMENSKACTIAGDRPTHLAYAAAKLCRDTLFEYGLQAKRAVECRVVTPALERVVEANVLLSGLGFESGGLSAAHGTVEGLTVFHHDRSSHISTTHGEEVAFGTIVLLVVEGRPDQEIKEVIEFCRKVGLPTTLKELGIGDATDEQLWKGAEVAATREILHNLDMIVTPKIIFDGIKAADRLASTF